MSAIVRHRRIREIENARSALTRPSDERSWYSGGSMSVPVTKFSLRVYGSKKAVEQEQERHGKNGSCVVHPYSNFRFYWDLILLFLLIISMVIIPVAITFFNDEMSAKSGWIFFHLFLDCWFFADIIMNFHTGVIVESGDVDVILDINEVRKRYLCSWFFIDLISTLPIDYVIQAAVGNSASVSASRAVKLLRFVKIISLLRLLRLSRLIRYVHQWEQVVGMQYDLAVAAIRIFNLVCLMLLIGHWNGCLQFLVPMLNDFPDTCWIKIDNLLDKPWGEQYSWCLFKAMSHMLCIGYGQEAPQNLMDLWMTMLSMVSGAVCFAMFIGHATALIQSMDSSKRQYKEKYMQVKEYMRFRRLPKPLRKKVYDYYENRFQGKMFNEVGILNELSKNLREDIVNYNCRHLVASVPFFKQADNDFVTEVIQKLKFEVFQPDDEIVREGEIGKKMYFIQHGVVEIRKESLPKPIKQLSDGSFFGEICLLTNDRRVATVAAVTYCDIYSLHVNDFNTLLNHYPRMRKTLERVAAARLTNIGHLAPALNNAGTDSDNTDTDTNDIVEEIVRHDDATLSEKMKNRVCYLRPGQRDKSFDKGVEIKTSKPETTKLPIAIILNPASNRKMSSTCDSEEEALFSTDFHLSSQSTSLSVPDQEETTTTALTRSSRSLNNISQNVSRFTATNVGSAKPNFFKSLAKLRTAMKMSSGEEKIADVSEKSPSPNKKIRLSASSSRQRLIANPTTSQDQSRHPENICEASVKPDVTAIDVKEPIATEVENKARSEMTACFKLTEEVKYQEKSYKNGSASTNDFSNGERSPSNDDAALKEKEKQVEIRIDVPIA